MKKTEQQITQEMTRLMEVASRHTENIARTVLDMDRARSQDDETVVFLAEEGVKLARAFAALVLLGNGESVPEEVTDANAARFAAMELN